MLLLLAWVCGVGALQLRQCTAQLQGSVMRTAPLRVAANAHRRAYVRACEPSRIGKGDLVDAISLKAGVNKKTAALVLGAALDVIVETVANGDKVSLVGFGPFHSKRKDARVGR